VVDGVAAFKKARLSAVGYMTVSAFGFAVMGMCVKLGDSYGFPIMQMMAARAFIAFLLSYWDVRRKKLSPWGNNRLMLFLRGVLGLAGLIAVYTSLTLMPLAEATLIQYLHPIFTAFLAWMCLGELIRKNTILCIIFSILGLLCIVQPESAGGKEIPIYALCIGLIGAAISAAAYTLVRYLSISEHPAVIVLYFPMVCLPVTFFVGWDSFIIPDLSGWLILLGIGVATQVGQVGMTKGVALEVASRATAFSYTQIVFAAALGVVVLGEAPSVATMMGALLIILGAIINTLEEQPKSV
jgi:drug/metabolite transporter (DMT)-like permease